MRGRMLTVATALVAAVLLTAGSPVPARTGETIVYQGGDPDHPGINAIFLADAGGQHVRRILADVSGDLIHPDWSPDGRSIAFVVDGQSIAIASASGARPRTVVRCGDGCVGVDFPAFAPNGAAIAYTRYVTPGQAGPPASSVIVVRDLRSGKERVVAHSDPGQLVDVPRWSHDGGRLAIGIDRFDADGNETGSAIAVVAVSSARLHRLTAFDRFAYAPDWSPCADLLVFSTETVQYSADPPSGPRDLFAIRSDGSGLRRLTHVTGDRMVWQPAFSADGRSIVATLDEPGARRGVRVDPSTGRIVRLGTPDLVMTHLKERLR